MMKLLSLFALAIAMSTGMLPGPMSLARAQSNCDDLDREVEARDLPCLVEELIPTTFPELEGARAAGRIHFRRFNSDEIFLKTTILSGQFRGTAHREYSIDVNPSMYRTFLPVLPRPSVRAVQAALARELAHLAAYEQSSALALTKHLKDKIFQSVAAERRADERALELGYGPGLLEFREWHYSRLTPQREAKVRAMYYTPEEIEAWIEEHDLARPEH